LIYAITLLQDKIQKERGSLKRALNLSSGEPTPKSPTL